MNKTGLFEETEKEALIDTADITGLFELSVDAYYTALYARMSCLPVKEEISRFIEKVKNSCRHVSAGKSAAGKHGAGKPAGEDRMAAARAASDRGDPDVLTVQKAAGNVLHEIHRLTGLLRFSPDKDGIYIARCAPDHFILPALAEHFTLRFGGTPWAIIDEKRNLCLFCEKGRAARLEPLSSFASQIFTSNENTDDFWEDLWRLYHRSVNNETRKNPNLQRQFMPERYQKYLPEMKP